MAQNSSGVVRRVSTLSILWGVSLICLGVLALASPLLAAVAVNALIGWLIIFAGVVHLVVAFHSREAGSVIWRLLVGLAYVAFGGYVIARPDAGRGVAHFAAGVAVPGGGDLRHHPVLPGSLGPAIHLVSSRRCRDAVSGPDDLHAVAVEFRVGNRYPCGREPHLQRCYARDGLIGSPQGHVVGVVAADIVSGVTAVWLAREILPGGRESETLSATRATGVKQSWFRFSHLSAGSVQLGRLSPLLFFHPASEEIPPSGPDGSPRDDRIRSGGIRTEHHAEGDGRNRKIAKEFRGERPARRPIQKRLRLNGVEQPGEAKQKSE